MFRFQEISYLLLFGVLLLIVVLFFIFKKWKSHSISKLMDEHLVQHLMKGYDATKENLRFILFSLALMACIIALANPQWGSKQERVKAKSSDIIIALDISQSMMAEDILPNRMERAKRFTERLIRSLKGERIGLISFAGSAYLQIPLTADYAAAEIFAKSANPQQAGTQGTAIADAIDLAQTIFDQEGPYQKALIIITDGENHDSDAIEAAEKAAENGTFIYTIGVGTSEGAYIPVGNKGRKEYKQDKQGNVVTSIMNRDMIETLAAAGKGRSFFLSQNSSIVDDIKKVISRMEKKEIQQQSFTDHVSYFQYFLGFAILCIIYRFFIGNIATKKATEL